MNNNRTHEEDKCRIKRKCGNSQKSKKWVGRNQYQYEYKNGMEMG